MESTERRALLERYTEGPEVLAAAFRGLTDEELDRRPPDGSWSAREIELLKHVLGHRYFMGLEQKRQVPMAEAAAAWYDNVYLPVVEVLRRHRVDQLLPGWTETDAYVEVTRHWLGRDEAGLESGPHEAVHELIDEWIRRRRGWRRSLSLPIRRKR